MSGFRQPYHWVGQTVPTSYLKNFVTLLQSEAPILPATLLLLQSALLQGGALMAVINFIAFLGKHYADPMYGYGAALFGCRMGMGSTWF
jgi:hypothetical protein